MGLQKNGVKISCEDCKSVAGDGRGGFDVTVPLSAAAIGVAGTARFHCVVTPERHEVELVGWTNDDRLSPETLEKVRQGVSDTLRFVAERRICGNHHVCPVEVIRIVKEHGGK
ncbi:MAG: hypothetical protein Q8O52_14845 [Sulfuritalea sp.]|nr:hypothetical protein [Sulfuritalea sp.]